MIDENKLMEEVRQWKRKVDKDCGEMPNVSYLTGYISALSVVEGMIAQQSTVDAVEVPCKIGQVVYMQYRDWDIEMNIQPFQITSIMISQNKKGIWTKKFRASWAPDGKTRDWSHNVSFDDIGKTVFFTREEAEKAWEAILAERRSDGEES